MSAKKLAGGIAALAIIVALFFAGQLFLQNRQLQQEKALEAAREAARVAATEAAEEATRDAGRTELRAGAIAWADWLAGQSAGGYGSTEFCNQFEAHRAPLVMLIDTDKKYLTIPQLKAVLAIMQANGRLQRLLFEGFPGTENAATKAIEAQRAREYAATGVDTWDKDVNHARDDCRDAVQAFLDTLP
jgi:hypothetical protein